MKISLARLGRWEGSLCARCWQYGEMAHENVNARMMHGNEEENRYSGTRMPFPLGQRAEGGVTRRREIVL